MKRTLLLILVLIIAAAGLVALSLNTKSTHPPAYPASFAQTTLVLTKPVASSSGEMTSNILINTQGNKVNAVQIELSYDPQALGNMDITAGLFIKSPTEFIKKIDTDNGRISYAIGVALGEKGTQGSGVVATLSFTKLKTSGLTSIDFLPKSLISAQEVSQSVLRTATGIKFDLSK